MAQDQSFDMSPVDVSQEILDGLKTIHLQTPLAVDILGKCTTNRVAV